MTDLNIDELEDRWNAQADQYNQWSELCLSEKIEFVQQCLIEDGWRQCAKGQRTTQYCGLMEAAIANVWSVTKDKLTEQQAEIDTLKRQQILLVATYAPEGVTNDEVAEVVAKVELMHGVHNA